jgi:hypothetical protein
MWQWYLFQFLKRLSAGLAEKELGLLNLKRHWYEVEKFSDRGHEKCSDSFCVVLYCHTAAPQ